MEKLPILLEHTTYNNHEKQEYQAAFANAGEATQEAERLVARFGGRVWINGKEIIF